MADKITVLRLDPGKNRPDIVEIEPTNAAVEKALNSSSTNKHDFDGNIKAVCMAAGYHQLGMTRKFQGPTGGPLSFYGPCLIVKFDEDGNPESMLFDEVKKAMKVFT